MSDNLVGRTSKTGTEWAVTRSSAGRVVAGRRALARLQRANAEPGENHSIAGRSPPAIATTGSIQNGIDADQFARDIAEIECASAALRAGAPDLVPWTADTAAVAENHKPPSVWLFVGTIWLTTMVVTGAATLAIASLL
jgi:YD repeat-containing protein